MGRLRDGGNGTPVAFFGGGVQEFQPDQIWVSDNGTKLNTLGGTLWRYLYYPSFHAVKLAVGNGTDVWRSTPGQDYWLTAATRVLSR